MYSRNGVLTEEQEQCVSYNSGDLLVRGIAGSGKSLVLLERALYFNRKAIENNKTIKVGIFTYANTLVKYTNDIAYSSLSSKNMIEVSTLDSYCMGVCYQMTGRSQNIIDNYLKKKLIKNALSNHKIKSENKNHRFYRESVEFWSEEFKWIKEKYLKSSDEYINSDRIGRGSKIRMSTSDKRISWEIYEMYCKEVYSSGMIDWEDIYIYILDNKDKIPNNKKFDYVFIDEAQDLSLVKLKVARLLSQKSVTIAADQAQKIYRTSFTWKDVGVDVRGRGSKLLKESFRSTRQIIQLADSLLDKNKNILKRSGEYTEPILPKENGPKPIIVCCADEYSQENELKNRIENEFLENPNSVIGVLYRTISEKNKIEQWLAFINIHCEEVKGKDNWSILKPGVKLITLHSAKGLELDTVYIPKVEKNVIPPSMDDFDSEEIEEALSIERSLLYVGMTRARRKLVLLYSKCPSRFINEMSSEYYNLELSGIVTEEMLPQQG